MQFFTSLTKYKATIGVILGGAVFCVSPQFLFAANPTSPILPNDNIQDPGDPGTSWGGCGPADSNCYVTSGNGSLAIGDMVAGATPGSVLFVDQSGNLGQNNPNFFWSVADRLLGVGTNTPGARIHSDGQTSTNASFSKVSKTVDNSNFDAFNLSGYYTGTTNDTWIIQIIDDSVDPQLFRYSTDNSATWSGNLPITTTSTLLQDGLEVSFGATTGYVNGDEWQFSVTAEVVVPDIDALLLTVNGHEAMRVGKGFGVRFFDAYNFPNADGNSGEVLTTDGAGNITWQAPGGGVSPLSQYAIGFGDKNNQLSGNNNKLFWNYDVNRMGVGDSFADTTLEVFSSTYTETIAGGWTGSISCTNCASTLDDLSVNTSSAYTETFDADYEVIIDGVGSPDTFSWYKDGVLKGSGVSILGGNQNQLLGDGVEINFDQSSGHVLGTNWLIHEYTSKPNKPQWSCTNCTNDLNDLSADASGYTGSSSAVYTVFIDDAVSVPNTFSWSKDGGPIQASGVPIIQNFSHVLSDGVIVTFGSDQGYTLNSSWDITVSYSSGTTTTVTNDPFQVRQDNGSVVFKVKSNGRISLSGVDYAFPTGQGGAGQVLTNDGSGNLSWTTVSGGGGGGSSLIGFTDSSSRYNTVIGYAAGYYIQLLGTGELNTYLGSQAGYANNSGNYNVAIGESAGHDNSTGSNNVFIGRKSGAKSGSNNNSGSDLIMIGANTGTMTGSTANAIAIGSGATADNDQFAISDSITSLKLRGVRWVVPSSQGGAGQVLTNDGSGNLSWTTVSGGGGGGSSYLLYNEATSSPTSSTVLSGSNAASIGQDNNIIGFSSVSVGTGLSNHTYRSIVLGSYNETLSSPTAQNYGSNEVNNWYNDTTIFVVGNGADSSNRSNALTILKNGQTGIGISSFADTTNGNIFQVGDGTNLIGYVDNGTGAWVSVSDERKKDNILDLSYGLDTVMGLKPVSFDYKRNGEHTVGFLAQEVKPLVPEAVFGTEEAGYGMSYEKIVPVTVKAIQDIFNLVESFREKLVAWFADAANGIGDLFVKRVRTETLCVGTPGNETCITKEQLDDLLGGQSTPSSSGGGGGSSPDPAPDPEPTPDPTPTPDPAPDPEPTPDPTPTPDPAPIGE